MAAPVGGLVVAKMPLIPPDAQGHCWAFYVVNGTSEPIEIVEGAYCEWKDSRLGPPVGRRVGPVAPALPWRSAGKPIPR